MNREQKQTQRIAFLNRSMTNRCSSWYS